jgi:two-component system response regulator YesN
MQIHIRQEDIEKAGVIKCLLEKEYYRHYTYDELARMVGTNTVKLMEAFKVITQKNVYQYLTLIRVEKASHLLETTELAIEVIASRVGWDKSNLRKQFKKMTGQTPNAWRKQPGIYISVASNVSKYTK